MQTDERQGPQRADNFLVQGTNVNLNDQSQGTRHKLVFTPGKKHLLRFINTSTQVSPNDTYCGLKSSLTIMQTYFRVSLDNHNMTVVQTDFVPVVPYVAETVGIAIGQRYSVIIEADQANATYWLRTWPQKCGGKNANDGTGTANAYVQYEPAEDILPTSTPVYNPDNCDDEFGDEIEPYLLVQIDQSSFNSNQTAMPVSGPIDYTFPGTNDTVNRCVFP